MRLLTETVAAVALFAAAVAASPVPASDSSTPVTLVSFSDPALDQKWSDMNDPVMGGKSHSTFSKSSEFGTFSGLCAIVPFLKAPG